MRTMPVMILIAGAVTAAALAEPAARHHDFEADPVGGNPEGWFVPATVAEAGTTVRVTDSNPAHGARCVEVEKKGTDLFGNLMQSFDAAPYRGLRVRLSASVRVRGTGPSSRAQMWMRVDRGNGQIGFFDNMFDRPISSARWSEHRITGDIDADAQRINVGFMVFGPATAWIDSISFEVVGAAGGEAARPLAPRGLENLVAFARLMGYVRHFHPSDEAADTDWDTFAIRGVQLVEPATNAAELAVVLDRLFRPIAPGVQVTAGPFAGGIEREPPDATGYTFWEHAGFGQHVVADAPRRNIYVSRRIRETLPATVTEHDTPQPRPGTGTVIEGDLGGGVSCRVPVSVYYDEQGTLPRGERLDWNPPADWIASGNDRATRLGGVVLAWNILQHFYPYFDVVDTDWPVVLEQTLAAAAEDPDAAAFGQTLGRMVAELHDGHGRVGGGAGFGGYRLPFEVDWIEHELVVTVATPDAGVMPGDVVVSIDGSTPGELWAQLTPTISAATEQWMRYRVRRLITRRESSDFFFAELRKPDGSRYSVRAKPVTMNTDLAESRPEKIAEVRPGIWYVDIDRITDQDFNDALRELKRAEGIVFDLRGYPGKLSAVFIAHLIDEPVSSAQWHVPMVYRPDRERMIFRVSMWNVEPLKPKLTERVAFLTDGRAISAAETYMGIIEHYQLAEIVGEATAGTNGNVNPIRLPGGYTISWTGMKVLKHDGSQHHGVGILPTIPVQRTIRGVAAGRDEILERGIEAVSKS